MENAELKQRQLNNLCKKITSLTRALIAEIKDLENTSDDEAAYHIMSLSSRLAEAKDKLFLLDFDEDELDLYEVCATAIRAAKEVR